MKISPHCLGITLGTCLFPTVLPAQHLSTEPNTSCYASLPDSAFTMVSVYLEAEAGDSAAGLILPAADALVELMSLHIRGFLGGVGQELPPGEPQISRRTLGRGVVVYAHRDGHISWMHAPMLSAEASPPSAGTLMLERALSAVRDSGEKIFLPDEAGTDSAAILISYRVPIVNRRGVRSEMKVRRAVVVFSLAVAWEEPARVLRPPRIAYPERPRTGGAHGVVLLKFVVDTLGRPDVSTFSDYWPDGRPQQTGELGEYYRAFVRAVRRGVAEMRFEPAVIGGCRVRQMVQLPVNFEIRQ